MAVATTERTYEVEGLGAAKVVRKKREVEFEFVLGTKPGREGVKKVLAVVSVSHRKAGVNYFSGECRTEDTFGVTLTNEEEEVGSIFTSRSFMVGGGLGLKRLPAGKRFSAKRLAEAADEGFAFFKELYEDGNEKVLRYFSMETGGDES